MQSRDAHRDLGRVVQLFSSRPHTCGCPAVSSRPAPNQSLERSLIWSSHSRRPVRPRGRLDAHKGLPRNPIVQHRRPCRHEPPNGETRRKNHTIGRRRRSRPNTPHNLHSRARSQQSRVRSALSPFSLHPQPRQLRHDALQHPLQIQHLKPPPRHGAKLPSQLTLHITPQLSTTRRRHSPPLRHPNPHSNSNRPLPVMPLPMPHRQRSDDRRQPLGTLLLQHGRARAAAQREGMVTAVAVRGQGQPGAFEGGVVAGGEGPQRELGGGVGADEGRGGEGVVDGDG